MNSPFSKSCLCAFAVLVAASTSPAAEAPPAVDLGSDANGNPLRRSALTGHVSNYDESKVGTYTLPEPLVLQNGQRVKDAADWWAQRRPEILAAYENEIYGRVPERAPQVTSETISTDEHALNDTAVHQHLQVRFGAEPSSVPVNVHLYLPRGAKAPVPVFLHLTFFTSTAEPAKAPVVATGSLSGTATPRPSEAGPIADFLAKGFGYALLRYTEIQPDNATTSQTGVQSLAYAPGQTQPADGEWGTIATWAWGASRILDRLSNDPAIDAKRVGLIGHSRLGKTVLWAGATDPRFALIFSSCAGEMGSALARRDYGETLDDMVGRFPWQFSARLVKYAGRWNELPVDAHLLISLCAPRPVFITGGTKDQWADPKGEFLAAVAAGPVYRLLGKKGLGTTELPPVDTPLIEGSLGFHYHTGGHTITSEDWNAFLEFASARWKDAQP